MHQKRRDVRLQCSCDQLLKVTNQIEKIILSKSTRPDSDSFSQKHSHSLNELDVQRFQALRFFFKKYQL